MSRIRDSELIKFALPPYSLAYSIYIRILEPFLRFRQLPFLTLLCDTMSRIILFLLGILECPHHLLDRAVLLVVYLVCFASIMGSSNLCVAHWCPLIGFFTNAATAS